MPTVVLVHKGGVGLSKPIIRLRIIENLRRFSFFSAQDLSVVVPDDFSRHSRALAKNLGHNSLEDDACGVARI